MICPYCQTENRDDHDACYYCTKDLSMLRLIVNKAKHHYNQALEYAERGRLDDAIVELKNALDLDGSMVGAHVVLGTLYAKKESFSEARESWLRALALSHHTEKAHEYLKKAENGEYVFPAMRRLKIISLSLGALSFCLLIVTLLLTASLARPRPGIAEVLQAAGLLKDGGAEKDKEAARLLVDVADRERADKLAKELAGDLRAYLQRAQADIQQEWQERLSLATGALSNDAPYTAMQILETVRDDKPGEAVLQSVSRIQGRALLAIARRVNESAEHFFIGELPFERFREEAQRYLNYVKSGPAHDEAAKTLERARGIHRARVLAESTAAISKPPLDEAVRNLADREGRYPDLAENLRGILNQRLAGEAGKIESDAEALVNQGQFDQARRRLRELGALYQTARRPAPEKSIAQWKIRIDAVERQAQEQAEAARRQAALAAAQKAFQNKQWESFIKLTGKVEELTGEELEQAKLTTMRAEALRHFAVQMWEWFQKRDAAFEGGRIRPEDAARAVKTYELTLANLPKNLAYARAVILFYAATAYDKLGLSARAREVLLEARRKYPKSYIIRSADQMLKRLGKEKGRKP